MQRSHTGASTVMTLLLAARGMRICSSLISPSVLSLHHYTAPVSRRSAASARCCSFLNKCNSNIFPMKQLSSTVSSNRHPAAAPLLLCTYCSTFERSNRGVASIDPPSRGHHGRVSPMWLSAGDVQSSNGDRKLSSDSGGDSTADASPRSPRVGGIERPLGIRRLGVRAGRAGGRGPSERGGRGSVGRGTAPYGGGRSGSVRGMHEGGGGGGADDRPISSQFSGNIPEDKLQVTFTRSSGAGGQNVNKVSTKVELRFVVEDADWLPIDVRTRLSRHQSSRVNKDGELVVTSQEFRTQSQNRSMAVKKLKQMVEEAWSPPKERNMRTGISKTGKAIRRADKEFRAKVKANRSKVRDFD